MQQSSHQANPLQAYILRHTHSIGCKAPSAEDCATEEMSWLSQGAKSEDESLDPLLFYSMTNPLSKSPRGLFLLYTQRSSSMSLLFIILCTEQMFLRLLGSKPQAHEVCQQQRSRGNEERDRTLPIIHNLWMLPGDNCNFAHSWSPWVTEGFNKGRFTLQNLQISGSVTHLITIKMHLNHNYCRRVICFLHEPISINKYKYY